MAMQHTDAQNHTSAAEHHEHAAHHHREAAKHHESGAHEKAGHHAHIAHGHARHHAEEASKHHEHGSKNKLIPPRLRTLASNSAAPLNDLLEISRDGEQGFRTCAEGVRTPNLKALLETAAAGKFFWSAAS